MNAVADAAVPVSRLQWWVTAAWSFAGAFALVLLAIAGSHSGGNWLGGPPSIAVEGSDFNVARGTGQQNRTAFVLQSLDATGLAILAARVSAFPANKYPRIEWKLRAAEPTALQLVFLWRTLEQPNRNFSKELEWSGDGVAPLELGAGDGWSGTIVGVALVVRGKLSQPLVLDSCNIPSVSTLTSVAEIGRQWSVFFPFRGKSITLPFDEERNDYGPLLVTVATAQALAMIGYYLIARRRGRPRDPRVFWAIFLAGWLLLDARWQANLWRQLALTAGQYAGKTLEEKHLAAEDRELFVFMRQVYDALPAPPVRIHFLADNLALRTRGSFFLYPQNVYHNPKKTPSTPNPDELRSGDYVLLFWYGALVYDREKRLVMWPDGRGKPADEIVFKTDGVVLLRMR